MDLIFFSNFLKCLEVVMKLKLSTLVLIILVIFAAYYFFVYSPCQNKKVETPAMNLNPPMMNLNPPMMNLNPAMMNLNPAMMNLNPRQVPTNQDLELGINPNSEITYLMQDDYPPYQENFQVTSVDSNSDFEHRVRPYQKGQLDLAGNTRPDNIMTVSEPVSYV
jgi:hypothetical protein